MINLATGITDIINDPMSHGFGAGIDNIPKQKATDTTKNTKKLNEIKVQTKEKTANSASSVKKESSGVNQYATAVIGDVIKDHDRYVKSLVDDVLEKTVDQMIQDEIRKGRLKLQTSQLGTTYATAKAYYKKLYDGSLIMTQLRNKTEKNISKIINKGINDKIASWQKGLPDFGKRILAKSKLMSSLTSLVHHETKSCIEAIFSDSIIKNLSSGIIANLKKTQTWIKTQITTAIGPQLEYLKKLRSAIQDKIATYIKMKEQFEQHIMTMINQYKEKLAKVVQEFTQKIAESAQAMVQNTVNDITKGATAK